MGIQFNIEPTLEQFEKAANDLLLRTEIDPVDDWSIFRLIILMTPEYRLEEQAENPLRIDAERVALAIQAYREGTKPGIRTYVDWRVEE